MINDDVLNRDNFACCYCGRSSREVHHIVYKSHCSKTDPLREALRNKITVCSKHHNQLHRGMLIVVYFRAEAARPRIILRQQLPRYIDRLDSYVQNGKTTCITDEPVV